MAAKQTPTESSLPGHPQESVRESAESLIIAFIMAFVFRAFVIEAFVIPTGSMAPTLYGRHGTMLCSDCGWEFAYGLTDLSSAARTRELLGPDEVAVCPNCNHRNPLTQINDVKGNGQAGDRILALKWPYDLGGRGLAPKRWDVALFKDPSDADLSDGVTNFIKRMVGLPNEVLEIVDGDVYTVPVAELSAPTLSVLDKARHAKYLRSEALSLRSQARQIETGIRRGESQNPPTGNRPRAELESQIREYEADARQMESDSRLLEGELRKVWSEVLDELARKMRICRKTPLARKALWTVLYDHDFPPRSRAAGQPYWTRIDPATAGWDAGSRVLKFHPAADRFEGLALRGKLATDQVDYNVRDEGEVCGVTDLRLRLVFGREAGEGTLMLKLPKRERSFWAELNSDGTLRLYETRGHLPDGQAPLAVVKVPPFEVEQPVIVDFQDVDYHLSLTINGEELLASTPEQFSPDIAVLRRSTCGPDRGEIQIFARGMTLALSHVVAERDVYYRCPHRGTGDLFPILAVTTGATWGVTGNPILLREGEYFMLGDNSPGSKDSRLWDVVGPHLAERGEAYQLGTVAADQLIGRAFFVYWPSGHRTGLLPAFVDHYGPIPNVGRMRWIR
jgi:DNA-directed RNA polymerase subunit RPC12/RpoP